MDIQIALLHQFVEIFLPPQSNRRKSNSNEMRYLYETLRKLFKQRFAMEITAKEVLGVFESLNYELTYMKGQINKQGYVKPSTDGDTVSTRGVTANGSFNSYLIYEENQSSFIYVNVAAHQVKNLRKCIKKLPPHTKAEIVEEVQTWQGRLSDFQKMNGVNMTANKAQS